MWQVKIVFDNRKIPRKMGACVLPDPGDSRFNLWSPTLQADSHCLSQLGSPILKEIA